MRGRYPPTCRSGMVLVVVLLVLFVIAALVLEFHYDARVQFQLAENTRTACQALDCAEAGLAIAMAALEQNTRIWTDDKLAGVLSGSVQVPVGQGYCTMSVVTESGRINVNELVDGNGRPVRTRIDQMLRLIDVLNAQTGRENRVGYDIIPAIIDWIDPDDEVTVLPFVQGRNAGAESDYYRGLEKPYRCRNRPLETMGELWLVRGMAKETFQEGRRVGHAGPTVGLETFLTVYGHGKLNVNDASVVMLQMLSEQIDRTMAETIVQHRPYTSMGELARVPGMTPEVLKVIRENATVQADADYYTVTTCGTVGKFTRTLRVVLCRDRRLGRLVPVIRWEL